MSPHAPPGPRTVSVIPARFRKRCSRVRPVSAHSADAAPLSDRVIIAQASARSLRVSDRCSAWALRSSAPRMITFTTLAESKCDLLSSRHTTPAPGSSTSTATKETRWRRAACTARLILVASAGWEDDAQMPVEAAAALDAAPAGPAANSSDGTTRTTAVSTPLGFTGILSGLPRSGCRQAVNPTQTHKDFVEQTLLRLGVPPLPDDAQAADGVLGWLHSVARKHVEVALGHPARLIANALGPPPPDVIASAHERGMLVAALAGKAEHARRQVASGVDIVVAQGYEAGGHTGEIATMVLVPEIVDAVGTGTPVLAAGGIGCGRQVAAALALGAVGAWMGSAWLLTSEYQQLSTAPAVQQALLAATSSDTTRSRIYSGKPARLLKNKWTDAWEREGAPEPLRMPLQNLLVSEAHQRLMRSGQPDVVPMPAGQIVGRISEIRPVADVMAELIRETAEVLDRLGKLR